MHLFTYGSLMFPEVWQRVVKRAYRHAPCTLAGFRRTAVVGEEYPVIFPTPGFGMVSGVVYFDIGPDDIMCLDAFEGDYYQRQKVEVTVDGTILPAYAYVLKDQYRAIALERDWDPESFRDSGMKRFIASYGGFGTSDSSR